MINKPHATDLIQNPQITTRKVMKMVKNERMGGYVPRWETPSTPKDTIQQNLSLAQNKQAPISSEYGLAYQGTVEKGVATSDEFTFADLVDIVNPLQHIPVVNYIYRNISGDEIKPIGNIVGGAVFGGPIGLASGLINTVIQEETGKDMAENAVAIALHGHTPEFKYQNNLAIEIEEQTTFTPENNTAPEQRLNEAVEIVKEYDDMASALLSFSDLGQRQGITIKRSPVANGRTAGQTQRASSYPEASQSEQLLREPITQVRFAAPNRLYNDEN